MHYDKVLAMIDFGCRLIKFSKCCDHYNYYNIPLYIWDAREYLMQDQRIKLANKKFVMSLRCCKRSPGFDSGPAIQPTAF